VEASDVRVRYDGKRGTWFVRASPYRDFATGKPVRKQHDLPGAETEEEALEAARAWFEAEAERGNTGGESTVSDMIGMYTRTMSSFKWADNTVASYGTIVKWVVPTLGARKVCEVTPADVEALYAHLRTAGRLDGSGGLSETSVGHVRDFMKAFYEWLVSIGAVTANPVDAAARPSAPASEARALSETQIRKLRRELAARMAETGTTRVEVSRRTAAFAVFLALHTGMRAGEVCGLALSDVNLVRGDVTVRSTVVEPRGGKPRRQEKTKGRKARRVTLDREARDAVRDHIAWQRTFLKPGACDDDDRALVCKRDGGLVRPTNLSHMLRALADDIGLPGWVVFHTLRHTHASLLFAIGTSPRVVQERLGHKDVAMTLRIYAHEIPGLGDGLADRFGEALGGLS